MWAQSSKSFSRRRGTPCRGAAARSGVTIICIMSPSRSPVQLDEGEAACSTSSFAHEPPFAQARLIDAEVETPTPSPAADPGSARELDLSQKKHPNSFSPSLSRGTCARGDMRENCSRRLDDVQPARGQPVSQVRPVARTTGSQRAISSSLCHVLFASPR